MTTGEARKVVQIMAKADGGCPHCVSTMIEDFLMQFKEFYEFEVLNWIREIDPALYVSLKEIMNVTEVHFS